MKSVLGFAAASVWLLLGALGAAAQNASTTAAATPPSASSEPTIEELYLQNVAMRIVREEATDLSPDFKLMALAGIREMIDSGTAAKNSTTVLDTLAYLSVEGSARPAKEGGSRLSNDFPEVRREACNLLGRVGGKESDLILMRVMRHDNDPIVLSEAAYALGQIGLNDEQLVSQHIALAVNRVNARQPDNNFAYASLLAFEKLAKKNKGLNDVTAFRAIMTISQGAYVYVVKQKALQLLADLKQY